MPKSQVIIVNLHDLLIPLGNTYALNRSIFTAIYARYQPETILAIFSKADFPDNGQNFINKAEIILNSLLQAKGIPAESIRFYNNYNQVGEYIFSQDQNIAVFSDDLRWEELSKQYNFQFFRLYPSIPLKVEEVLITIMKITQALNSDKKILISLDIDGTIIFKLASGQVFFNRSIFDFIEILKDQFPQDFPSFEFQFLTARVADNELNNEDKARSELYSEPIIEEFLNLLFSEKGISIKRAPVITLGGYDSNDIRVCLRPKSALLAEQAKKDGNLCIVHVDDCNIQADYIKHLDNPDIWVISVTNSFRNDLNLPLPVTLKPTFVSNRVNFFSINDNGSKINSSHKYKQLIVRS